MTGRLRITDQCVFVEPSGGNRQLVVLAQAPERWIWDATTRELVIVRGGRPQERFGDGDLIGLGGGPVGAGGGTVEGDLRAMTWISPPDPECITPEVWLGSGDILPPDSNSGE